MKKIIFIFILYFFAAAGNAYSNEILLSKYKVKLLSKPNFSGGYISQFVELTKFKVIGTSGEWVEVTGPNGEHGFLAKKWLLDEETANIVVDKANRERETREKEKQIEISNIKNKLNNIPESNYEDNIKLYRELSFLDKDNNFYKDKLYFYIGLAE